MVVAATACWGCGTVLSKQVLDRGVAPMTLLVIELAASVLLLGAGVWVLKRRGHLSSVGARLALLGVLNPGVAYALGLWGLTSISASLSVLLWATEPILIVGLAVLLLRERVAAATVAGLLVALVGVALVIYRPGASGALVGVSLTVAAVGACALYTVLTRRLLLDDGSLEVVLVQQLAALGFAVVVALATWVISGSTLGLPSEGSTWALAGASGAVYYGLAFWFFIAGLRGLPASVAGSALPLIPVFGLAGAYLVGDRLAGRQWLGAALVLMAIAAVLRAHRGESRRVRPPRRG